MLKITRKLRGALIHIADYAYSIIVNYSIFPWRIALKLPLKVSHRVDFLNFYRGCVEIEGPISRFMINIGLKGFPLPHNESGLFMCREGAKVVFRGRATLSDGIRLYIESGTLTIGKHTHLSPNVAIQCREEITIGDNCIVGWNSNIRDTDGHTVETDGIIRPMNKAVRIENNVWVGSDSTILKGSVIAEGCVVACGSIVCGYKAEQKNCLIAGVPAKVKKQNIVWHN